MSVDFESAFYRIVADCYEPDDNVPQFPPTSHATPREWMMHERVADDVPVNDRSRVPFAPFGLLENHAPSATGEWTPATNHHNATYNHPGNVNPFRAYPHPGRPDLPGRTGNPAYDEAMRQLNEQRDPSPIDWDFQGDDDDS